MTPVHTEALTSRSPAPDVSSRIFAAYHQNFDLREERESRVIGLHHREVMTTVLD